jgi:hypothetical protein
MSRIIEAMSTGYVSPDEASLLALPLEKFLALWKSSSWRRASLRWKRNMPTKLKARIIKLENYRRARQADFEEIDYVATFETQDKVTYRLSDGWHESRRAGDESYQQFEQRIKAEMEEELGPGPIRVIFAEQYKALRDRVMESV